VFYTKATIHNDYISAKAQKEHHEKKEKAKLSRTQIDFTAGSTTKRSIPAPATAATTGEYQMWLLCDNKLSYQTVR